MTAETSYKHVQPSWLEELLDVALPKEGTHFTIRDLPFVMHKGIPRSEAVYQTNQAQTASVFDFKWHKRDTYESKASLKHVREWLINRYGDVAQAQWMRENSDPLLFLDAGCGGGMSSLELFGQSLNDVHYLGVDISGSVDVASERFAKSYISAGFLQAGLDEIPLAPNTVDVIFSEGVLHHTDSTEGAIRRLAALLSPGGRLLFYVYRKKGPVREFTDDYIRDKLQTLSNEEAWKALMPLTRLGKTLGDLGVEIDIPEDIELLGIPAGKIDIQRLFYWHVAKAFYQSEMSLDELNHRNFDWYAPTNAHRQTPEEVFQWCDDAGLLIEHHCIEDAGITVVARKKA